MNLGRNKIEAGSTSPLGKLFISSKTLKEINLGKNNISDDGITILKEIIGDWQIGLHMFNVRDNNISEKSANDFASFLKGHVLFFPILFFHKLKIFNLKKGLKY